MTAPRPWRTAYATSLGTSHEKAGTPCQDAAGCLVLNGLDGTEILLVAVSDGAGTAARSDIGSTLAVEHFLAWFSRAAESSSDLDGINQEFVDRWLADVRRTICRRAEADGADVRDYACTMVGIVVGASLAASVQIGDGAIVVSTEERGRYAWVFWPQHGEFANSTFFLTQAEAGSMLQFEVGPAPDEVAVFSDGIERLVLDMSSRSVHAPAFQPIFDWLSGTEPDHSRALSAALGAYLGSDHVNKRTDDDKTLVMATRALPRAAG